MISSITASAPQHEAKQFSTNDATRRDFLAGIAMGVGASVVSPSFAEEAFSAPLAARHALFSELQADVHSRIETMSKIVLALRLSRGHAVDLALDPTGSGLIGLPNSEVTSSHGTLFDKQASILPATADKILECLISAGVGERSRVAVCLTGSFPGANIALGACLAALKAEPTIIASAASSSYGANIPDLLWLDMEQAIPRAVLPHRPCAASIGGNNDLGANTERPDILREAIEAAKLPIVEGMDARMRIFDEHLAQGERYALFVNVGGGSAAIGGTAGKSFPLGLWRVDATMEGFDCISLRMHRRGTPVLNLRGIAQFLRGETYLRLPSSEGQ